MTLRCATAIATAFLALPASAMAANVAVVPAKSCYRSGEQLFFTGAGFTPAGRVTVTADGLPIGSLAADGQGGVGGQLMVARRSGQGLKSYVATDQPNPVIKAAVQLRVSAFQVRVSPRSGRPGRSLRIRARGFTDTRNLHAHVVKGRYRRNVKVGRLRGACGTLTRRKRLFPRRTKAGTYTVQFDGKRRYSRSTAVGIRFRVVVFRRVGRSAAFGPSWTRLP
jgi:hypothetical protein